MEAAEKTRIIAEGLCDTHNREAPTPTLEQTGEIGAETAKQEPTVPVGSFEFESFSRYPAGSSQSSLKNHSQDSPVQYGASHGREANVPPAPGERELYHVQGPDLKFSKCPNSSN